MRASPESLAHTMINNDMLVLNQADISTVSVICFFASPTSF